MRSNEDLIPLTVLVVRRLSLDRERMELDPVWRQISEQVGLDTPEKQRVAVQQYVRHYTINDQFPHQMPATNGPGDIGRVDIEIGE
jgi:hypothetical protein